MITYGKPRKAMGLRRPTSQDTLGAVQRQGQLARQARDPLAAYDRLVARMGSKYGVDDDTIAPSALRRARR